MSEDDAPVAAHRAGFVALLGPPNTGKSTLLNQVLGEKLAIVSGKPQTTRSRILGICNRPGGQLLFVDTPGLHEGTRPLNAALNKAVEEAAGDCDLGLLLVDPRPGWTELHQRLLDVLSGRGVPAIGVGTKSDLPRAEVEWPDAVRSVLAGTFAVSGRTGAGVEALVDGVTERLPEGPPLYPDDALTDRPVRWLAAELVREAAFEELEQELPYAIAVEVVRFDESREGRVHIDANVLVSRDSQKRIVVGSGGQVIKRIGIRARRGIEELLDTRVGLKLFVKVDPRWLKSPKRIASLGYR
ncbi:MAG: GTPase Era [Myxococcota bacterium]